MRGSVKSKRMKLRSRSGISAKSTISAAASGFQARMSWVGVITIAGASMRPRRRCRYGLTFCGARRRDFGGCAGEFVHIGALIVVQPKDAGKRREHRPRRPDPPLLEARVVGSRDRRELGDLLV